LVAEAYSTGLVFGGCGVWVRAISDSDYFGLVIVGYLSIGFAGGTTVD